MNDWKELRQSYKSCRSSLNRSHGVFVQSNSRPSEQRIKTRKIFSLSEARDGAEIFNNFLTDSLRYFDYKLSV